MENIRPISSTVQNEFEMQLEGISSYRHQIHKVSENGMTHYVKKYHDQESFETEVAALTYLQGQACGFVIPEIIVGLPESNTVILSEVSGEPLKPDETTDEVVDKLALSLKALHTIALDECLSSFNYQEKIDLFESRINESPHIEEIMRRKLLEAISLLRSYFSTLPEPSNIVHGDFNRSNILYDENTQSLGLIDFERTHIGFPSIDLSRAAWRILGMDDNKIKTLLQSYYGDQFTQEKQKQFLMFLAYDFIGAAAYYAQEGHLKGYPFYDEVVEYLDVEKLKV